MRRTIVHLLTAASLFISSQAVPAVAETRELLLAAYSVPKEAYEKRIIPAFEQQWKQKTGETIRIHTSFAASGAQARAIIGGLEADVAALSLESDLQQLVKGNLVTHDWKQGPRKGVVTTSVVALGVRKGNPKGIKNWEDLAKPGVEVLYPSPKTSGGAMWDVIAIYGAGLKLGKQRGLPDSAAEQYASDLLKRIQRNVKVMDKSGRESVTTFERGVGDVIVTYENELAPRITQGRPYELIIPAETVLIENPIAVVDRNADRHRVRDLAEAFVSYLYGDDAQRAFAEFAFRPTNESTAKSFATTFVQPPALFTIAELGGWDKVFSTLFGQEGSWTKAVEELARAH
ncbi:sulfate ABC transporter substrate-binding protein [Nitrospira sp. NS4]|uniref:sulfate ABC transporter substrate-binding protein n=1 Tax=Nitrospira sp. NS4 TaxID=3414498 RepID=UPI003C2EDBA7